MITYGIPCVYLSICLFFWIFFVELTSLKWPKWLFWKKSSFKVFRPKWFKMGPKWGFSIYEKLILGTFLIFLHKFTIAWRLKIDRPKWLSGGETFFWNFCTKRSLKQALNENVLVLSKIIVQKVSNWLNWFCWRKFPFWKFWTKKHLKWVPNFSNCCKKSMHGTF